MTLICSEGAWRRSDVGAVGADTVVCLARAQVCWKAEGDLRSSLLTLSASAWYSTLGFVTVAR